jgi:hypothetical protein
MQGPVSMKPNREDLSHGMKPELSDEEEDHIRSVFHEEIAPKLIRLQARTGTISCAFAGHQYRNWTIRFNSRGSDFEILDFEYDEDAEGIDLDL